MQLRLLHDVCMHAGVLYIHWYIYCCYFVSGMRGKINVVSGMRSKCIQITAHDRTCRKRTETIFFRFSVKKCRKRVFFVSGKIAPAANGNGGSV